MDKGQNKGWRCRLSDMISTVKLNATAFGQSFDCNCVGNGKKVLTVSVLDGMCLLRRSNSHVLSKLYGGGGDWKKGKLPEV